jgi:TolB-like protein/DNA-binding winged helix-turn-helix (wHTH) protein/Tfp pilus assembly protein PilF
MVYRFDQFEVDDREFRLSEDGTPIQMEPKVLRLLIYLIENRNRLVRKQELLDAVWTDAMVTENALTRSVGLLRKALNEDSRLRRYLETVPTVGYRFIAEVTVEGPIPAAEQAMLAKPVLAGVERPAGIGAYKWWISAGVLIAAGIGWAAVRLHASAGPPIQSIAVLPLENRSSDANQRYFADGVTEAITTELAQVGSLRVVSRASANQYRDGSKSVQQIAKELGVDAVVEGSVAREGDHVQVAAELIQASTDRHLWADRYDRKVGDILNLESELAKDIARHVKAVLTPNEKMRLDRSETADPVAYDLFLQGEYSSHMLNRDDNDRAISLFEQAVARDPRFAPAYAALAYEYGTRANNLNHSDDTWNRKAFVAAERCIELDPELGDCYQTRATLLWTLPNHFPYASAIADLKHSLALNPNLYESHEYLANIYNHIGLFEKAKEHLDKAEALNPGNAGARFRIGVNLNYQGQYEDALHSLRGSERFMQSLWAFQVSFALVHLGRWDEASTFLQQATRNDTADTVSNLRAIQAVIAAHEGNTKVAEQKIAEAIRWGSGFEHFHHAEYAIASAYALMSRKAEAVEWLRRSADDGFPCYPVFAGDSNLANLHGDPQYEALMTELRSEWQHNMTTL